MKLTHAACILSLCVAVAVHAAPPDPVEGNWLGQSGPADNRATLGLEITRKADGQWEAFLLVDLLNFYYLPAGSPLKLTAPGRYSNGAGLDLVLEADTMTATGFLENGESTVTLHRAAARLAPPARKTPPAGPGPLWRAHTGGAIFAAAAVRDGVAYVGNIDGVFSALKISDGSRVWAFAAGRPIYGEALVTDDAVFFVCDNGYLFRLNRADGKEVWRYDLGDARVNRVPPNPGVFDYDYTSPRPVLADGTLYVGSGDGGFHAVSADTGTRVWRIGTQGKVRTTAAVAGSNVTFGTLGNFVCTVERATGKSVWQYDARGPVTGAPAVIAGRLIVGSRASNVHALDLADGRELWSQFWWGSWVESTAVESGGIAYLGSGDLCSVSAIDPATGRNLWRTNLGGWAFARPAVTANRVFAGVSGTRRISKLLSPLVTALAALDRDTGQLLWSWPIPESPGAFFQGFIAAPVVAGDILLAGGLDGTLYAFPAN